MLPFANEFTDSSALSRDAAGTELQVHILSQQDLCNLVKGHVLHPCFKLELLQSVYTV